MKQLWLFLPVFSSPGDARRTRCVRTTGHFCPEGIDERHCCFARLYWRLFACLFPYRAVGCKEISLLSHFDRRMGMYGPPDDFLQKALTNSTAEIEAWIKHLARSEKRLVSFRHQALMALKFLYFVTLDRPQVAACFLSPGKPGPIPDPLSLGNLNRLLDGVTSELHKTVLTVTFGGGLRIGETCRLRTGDIDGKRMLIRLESTNSAWPQFIPLHPETLDTLRRWWRDTRPRTDLLFTRDHDGNPLTPGPMQKAIRQAASLLAIWCG